MDRIVEVLTRKKVLDATSLTETQLARVLNTFDLTALGVGSTLGVGVYVLAGQVAKEVAGPAVVLSFLIAAIASVFAGLCYAEFGARVPRAGSAYVYSYVCIGEFVAFIIGWNLILEYVIGSASVAKGLSLYLDTLINNTLQNTFREIAPIDVSFLGSYFDFFSFGISVILAIALAFGLKKSATVNTIFTILNLFVVVFIIIAGAFKAHGENWSLPAPSDPHYGKGGFFPYGVTGLIKGAATCFYGFVGFDCIATTGEEVRNPQRAIPLAIIASLAVIFLAYFGTATVVTLMVPYYLQDINAPIPHAFEMVGWNVAKWIVAIGGIFGLCASLFGAMFPLPRIIYAMANDGIIFRFLGTVNSRFQTPLVGTLLAGILTGLMSALFDLKHLVDMMSIGTLLAYSIVAACVLLLRYSTEEIEYNLIPATSDSESDGCINSDSLLHTTSTDPLASDDKISISSLIRQTFNLRLELPTKLSQRVVAIQIYIFVILSVMLWLCTIYLENQIKHAEVWAIILISIIGLLLMLSVMSIATQPNSQAVLTFKVPLVPLIPAISILINIYLMLMLDVHTWIRFGVWMAVGLPIYFISIRCCSLSNNKMHAKANGNLHKIQNSNGQANVNYITEDNTENHKKVKPEQKDGLEVILTANSNKSNVKLKPKAPNPSTVSQPVLCSSLDSLSVTGALAALDEVLTKEELAIGPFSYDNPFGRKISIDTVSNASNIHYEESVVALVHNEDIYHEHEHPPPILEEHTDIESDCSINTENEDYQRSIPLQPSVVLPNESNSRTPSPPNDTKDVKLSQERLSLDSNNHYVEIDLESHNSVKSFVLPAPPPPPPIDGFLTFKVQKSRPSFIRSRSEPDVVFRAKIKQQDSPPESKSNSEQEDSDDNIAIGSAQYKKVALKLNKLFQRRSLGLPNINKLTKPELSTDNEKEIEQQLPKVPGLNLIIGGMKLVPTDVERSGVVEEEVMKPIDIKKKLNDLLRSDPRLTLKEKKTNNILKDELQEDSVKITDDISKPNNNVREELQEDSVKIIDDISKPLGDKEGNAKTLHKNLMGNTLRSIKLLKKDSFIINEIESDK